jgi:hypothetical protein
MLGAATDKTGSATGRCTRIARTFEGSTPGVLQAWPATLGWSRHAGIVAM